MRTHTLSILLLCLAFQATAQQQLIRIRDAATRAPIPFAAIRLGNSGQGVIADLDGLAHIPVPAPGNFIEISALSYDNRRIEGRPDSVILLTVRSSALRETVVRPDEERIRRIIRKTVAQRDAHNPEHYDRYSCKVYYKMVADIIPRDSSFHSDTSREARSMVKFFDDQHLLLSETYSRRNYKRPEKLQEDIIATRFSGFKSPLFASLVTDVLPFHCYSDYLKLNGRDFRNPLSPGSAQWFRFNLHDELLQGSDTLWIISFFPKKAGEGLRGRVFINSKDYAVTNLIASYKDTVIGSDIRVEQGYTEVNGKWFPQQLNYTYRFGIADKKKSNSKSASKAASAGFAVFMQGTSRIDSVRFDASPAFHFDKVHTVRLEPAAGNMSDSDWNSFRPDFLDRKEARTYVFMDSAMGVLKADRFIPVMSKLLESKVGIGPLDLNINRLFQHNSYEGNRFGLGLQTGDSLFKHFSIGAWAGYGFKDEQWKWGVFAEVFLDQYKESSLRLQYDHDIRDPGRIDIHPELNRNYLRNYLIHYADAFDAYILSLSHRFGYLSAIAGLRHEALRPQYDYEWNWEGLNAKEYTADEASLSLRYAFAERSAPVLGKYYATGSSYPVLYAKGTYGTMDIGGRQINYTQVLGAFAWQKHIARIGMERWLLEGGKIWSNAPLPIGKLFGAPAFRNDDYRVYVFGGLQTVFPYQYFMDRFVFGSWRHDFDWRLYRADFGSGGSMPGLSLVYNGLWGQLSDHTAQHTFSFSSPEKGYHEGGLLIRDLLRLQYLHLYYIGLNAGYFLPLQNTGFDRGVFVFGLNVSL